MKTNKKSRRTGESHDVFTIAVSVGTDLTGAPAPYKLEILGYEVVGIDRISWEKVKEIIPIPFRLQLEEIESAIEDLKR